MEGNKNHIDDFLRDKMQGLHFELNEQHWADAERRLDEDDRKKKPIWLLLFVAVALVGAGITALTNGLKHQDPPAKPVQLSQNIENNKTNSSDALNYENSENTSANVTEDSGNVDYVNNKNQSSASGNNYTPNNNQTNSGNLSHDAATPDSKAVVKPNLTNTAAFTKASSVSNAVSRKQTTPNSAKTNKIASSNQAVDFPLNDIDPILNMQAAGKVAAKQLPIKKTKVAKNPRNKTMSRAATTKNTQAQVKSAAKNNKVALRSSNVKQSASPSQDKMVSKKTDDEVAKLADAKPAVAMLGNKPVYRSPEDYQKMNPRYVAGLENYTFTETVIPLGQDVSDSIRHVLAMQNAEAETEAVAPKNKPYKKETIYVQDASNFYMLLGIAGARGYRGNMNENPSWGLSPSIGAGYEFTFSDRMSIYLSAFMTYVSNLNIEESGTNITYSFDRDSTLMSVTRKNLLQLHLPLELSYKIRPKHRVYGGLGVNLALNSVSLYEDSKSNGGQNQFGYMNGLRFVDINASLGYEFSVSRRLGIGIFYQQGLFDVTKNDYFNNQHNDQNARGGLRLRYKFIK